MPSSRKLIALPLRNASISLSSLTSMIEEIALNKNDFDKKVKELESVNKGY